MTQAKTAVETPFVLDLPLATASYGEAIAIIEDKPKIMSPQRRAALGIVNLLRRQAGLEPIADLKPGTVGDPNSCVISASLLYGTGDDGSEWTAFTADRVELRKNGKVVARVANTPPEVSDFYGRFDQGEMRDLDSGRDD